METPTQIIVLLFNEIKEQLMQTFYCTSMNELCIDITYDKDSNCFDFCIRVGDMIPLTGKITYEFINDLDTLYINPYRLVASHIVQEVSHQKGTCIAGFEPMAEIISN